jgi:hypothetical protein
MPIAPPSKMDLFEDWAEDTFQKSGTGTGVTINPPRRDKHGWDFIAEWDEEPVAGIPRDRQVIARTTRIQVKSSRQSRPTVKLKLSNALRFVEANEPCFVVLYWLNRKKTGVEVYGRHFDEALIAATLKRAREADRDSQTDHHKLFIYITMQEEDLHTHDVIPWIQSHCKDKPAEYAQWKAGIREAVGGRGLIGTIKIPVAETTTFIEHAVGLQQDFNPNWIEFRETRFGIASNSVAEMDNGVTYKVNVKPRPSAMHFETEGGERVSFEGVTKSIQLPGYADADLIGAFHAKHLTARVYSSLRMDATYHLNGSDVDEIRSLRDILKLFCLFGTDQMHVVYELEGKQLDRGAMSPIAPVEEREMFLWAIDRLDAMLMCTRASEHPRLSVMDMLDHSEALDQFYSCIVADSTTLKLWPKTVPVALPEPVEMVGYCHVEIANTVYTAFYHQLLLTKQIQGEETIIEFGKPTIIARWAKSGTAEQHMPRIKQKFRSVLNKRPSGTIYFNEGDMMSALLGAQDIGMRVANEGK